MTKSNLITLLSSLGTVVDNHNTTSQTVTLPYFVVIEDGTANFKADNQVYVKKENFTVILVEGSRDATLEANIETLFNSNHIPYEIEEIEWDEDLLIWTIQYEL